jgi:hypothetical protein
LVILTARGNLGGGAKEKTLELCRQARASFGSSGLDNAAAGFGAHARAEAVPSGSF